ncbi:hypothetical protein A3736_01020 [Erythrobacter sp. HI0063]|uniref:hypothetical protein n=1 Tax=Erythrobacter sp. HI0063 TaxID=1822240 RepID=UPI0007C2530E|nr:hypothetical protein [Erythrobacter sp. HI0063]KZY55932.1 hypothetical protein A3736_01020 [Erythrobacter sp. HI0063]
MIPTAAIAMSDAPNERPVVLLNWKRMSFPLGYLETGNEIARAAISNQFDGNDLESAENG